LSAPAADLPARAAPAGCDFELERIAAESGAQIVRPAAGAPVGYAIDTRRLRDRELFVALPGARTDGARFAQEALAKGAWGVLLPPAQAGALFDAERAASAQGAILAHPHPLHALGALARAWRRELAVPVIAITGSAGKTSTRQMVAALLAKELAVAQSPSNYNTEIGLPLAILEAPRAAQALVLELAMRGAGQIAQLACICEPDVGVIVNIGPVHLELLGSLEAIAAAKAELIAQLRPGAAAVLPAGEPLLAPHRRGDLRTITFGAGGEVRLLGCSEEHELLISSVSGRQLRLRPNFSEPHNLHNLLAAVAAVGALGHEPEGELAVDFQPLRGERRELPNEVTLINDCYNANPLSMRAALAALREQGSGRRVAVLGDMLELGPDELAYHRELAGALADAQVRLLITVGPRAAELAEHAHCESYACEDARQAARRLAELLAPGDTVLIKGSRALGLERIATLLADGLQAG
jgi:UDP-N-acetylmuramoyl-tripeptide--D-alanyl-D-alanine ligase